MPLLDPALELGLLRYLGLTNVIFIALVWLSCRCRLGSFGQRLMERGWYRKFYNWHCWYWWAFILSVLIHATFAIDLFGLPF